MLSETIWDMCTSLYFSALGWKVEIFRGGWSYDHCYVYQINHMMIGIGCVWLIWCLIGTNWAKVRAWDNSKYRSFNILYHISLKSLVLLHGPGVTRPSPRWKATLYLGFFSMVMSRHYHQNIILFLVFFYLTSVIYGMVNSSKSGKFGNQDNSFPRCGELR